MEKIKLTQTVQKGGCAAKIAATELRQILQKVKFPPSDSNLQIDGASFDDAAIYKVPEHVELLGPGPYSLVQTLDFFTPIVDDPATFGRIAAANSLSDVYAMGGIPKTAMAILAFPLATLPSEVIVEVLQGASDLLAKAGTHFVGGHSIDDDTLKFGLSVTGFVNSKSVWSNSGAQPGDHLLLTKPLGTGTAMASLKQGRFSEDDLRVVLDSMSELNNILSLLSMQERSAIHAATDITGFGLMGHAQQMAKASGVQMHLSFKEIPVFDIAKMTLKEGFLTKAHRTNAEYTQSHTLVAESVKNDPLIKIIYDPQTSGGLLLSVSADSSEQLLRKLQVQFPRTKRIGEVSDLKSSDLWLQLEI